jgi:hypothetical protein
MTGRIDQVLADNVWRTIRENAAGLSDRGGCRYRKPLSQHLLVFFTQLLESKLNHSPRSPAAIAPK